MGGFPRLCNLSVLEPIGIAELPSSYQGNFRYAILVLKRQQQFLFPICTPVWGVAGEH